MRYVRHADKRYGAFKVRVYRFHKVGHHSRMCKNKLVDEVRIHDNWVSNTISEYIGIHSYNTT